MQRGLTFVLAVCVGLSFSALDAYRCAARCLNSAGNYDGYAVMNVAKAVGTVSQSVYNGKTRANQSGTSIDNYRQLPNVVPLCWCVSGIPVLVFNKQYWATYETYYNWGTSSSALKLKIYTAAVDKAAEVVACTPTVCIFRDSDGKISAGNYPYNAGQFNAAYMRVPLESDLASLTPLANSRPALHRIITANHAIAAMPVNKNGAKLVITWLGKTTTSPLVFKDYVTPESVSLPTPASDAYTVPVMVKDPYSEKVYIVVVSAASNRNFHFTVYSVAYKRVYDYAYRYSIEVNRENEFSGGSCSKTTYEKLASPTSSLQLAYHDSSHFIITMESAGYSDSITVEQSSYGVYVTSNVATGNVGQFPLVFTRQDNRWSYGSVGMPMGVFNSICSPGQFFVPSYCFTPAAGRVAPFFSSYEAVRVPDTCSDIAQPAMAYTVGSTTLRPRCEPLPTGWVALNKGPANEPAFEAIKPDCVPGEYVVPDPTDEVIGYDCNPCPVGFACDGLGYTACTGQSYQPSVGQSSCETCDTGSTGTPEGQATSCTPNEGYYNDGTSITPCTAGYGCPGGDSDRIDCGAQAVSGIVVGYYQPREKQSGCLTCTYPFSATATSCQGCSAYEVPNGSGGCTVCDDGYRVSTAAEFESTGSFCQPCTGKYACKAGKAPFQCPQGTSANADNSACEMCPAGTYGRPDGWCEVCFDTTVSGQGWVTCMSCPDVFGLASVLQESKCFATGSGNYGYVAPQNALLTVGDATWTLSTPATEFDGPTGQCSDSEYLAVANGPGVGASDCQSCGTGEVLNPSGDGCVCDSSAGYFMADICRLCPAGHSCTDSSATPCDGNTYSTLGDLGCHQCINEYVNFEGDGCYLCGAGEYYDGTGCLVVPPGKFLGDKNGPRADIQDCDAQQFCEGGDAAPVRCSDMPVGLECVLSGGFNVKQPCGAGTFWEDAECCGCLAGHVCAGGSSSPVECASTEYVLDNVCQTCSDGSYASNHVCEPCEPGHWCKDGATKPCAAGSYSAAEASECTTPSNGFYVDANTVYSCEPGYRCTNGGRLACEAHAISGAEAASCSACAPNEIAINGRTVCDPCPGGQTPVSGENSCSSCPTGSCLNGTVCDPSWAVPETCAGGVVTTCTGGTYVPDGGVGQCVTCSEGHYCSGGVERLCDGYQYAGPGASVCSSCSCEDKLQGLVVVDGLHIGCEFCDAASEYVKDNVCTAIPAGHERGAANDVLVACEAWEYSVGGGEPCVTVPEGKFTTDSTKALGCPSQEYCAGGSAQPVACPAGFTCQDGKKVDCPAERRVENNICQACGDGVYCPGDGTSQNCPVGPVYCAAGAIVKCETVGTYVASDKRSCPVCARELELCPGDGSRYTCVAGHTSAPPGLAADQYCEDFMLKTCPTDSYIENGKCLPCPAGFQCANGAKTACTAAILPNYCGGGKPQLCEDGGFVSADFTQCRDCPANEVCEAGVKKPCVSLTGTSYCVSNDEGVLAEGTCPPGSYIDSTRMFCVLCDPGYACNGTNATTVCNSGFYSATEAASSCTNATAEDARYITYDNDPQTGFFTCSDGFIAGPYATPVAPASECVECGPDDYCQGSLRMLSPELVCSGVPGTVANGGAFTVECSLVSGNAPDMVVTMPAVFSSTSLSGIDVSLPSITVLKSSSNAGSGPSRDVAVLSASSFAFSAEVSRKVPVGAFDAAPVPESTEVDVVALVMPSLDVYREKLGLYTSLFAFTLKRTAPALSIAADIAVTGRLEDAVQLTVWPPDGCTPLITLGSGDSNAVFVVDGALGGQTSAGSGLIVGTNVNALDTELEIFASCGAATYVYTATVAVPTYYAVFDDACGSSRDEQAACALAEAPIALRADNRGPTTVCVWPSVDHRLLSFDYATACPQVSVESVKVPSESSCLALLKIEALAAASSCTLTSVISANGVRGFSDVPAHRLALEITDVPASLEVDEVSPLSLGGAAWSSEIVVPRAADSELKLLVALSTVDMLVGISISSDAEGVSVHEDTITVAPGAQPVVATVTLTPVAEQDIADGVAEGELLLMVLTGPRDFIGLREARAVTVHGPKLNILSTPETAGIAALALVAVAFTVVFFVKVFVLPARASLAKREALRDLKQLGFEGKTADMVADLAQLLIPGEHIDFDGEVLGRGGFGVVKSARYMDAPVVIKQLHAHLLNDETAVASLCSEALAQAELVHPHVVRLMGVLALADTFGVVSEFCPNGSLKDIRDDGGRTPLARRVELLQHAAAGLAFMHNRGYAHRDIKSANVFVGTDDKAKLGDLGLVADSSVMDAAGMEVLGTPAWMSPELLEGGMGDQRRADVYAFGVMMYEVLFGQEPYLDVPVLAIAVKVLEGMRPRIPAGHGVPRELVGLMQDCWDADPDRRPLMTDVGARLAAFAEAM